MKVKGYVATTMVGSRVRFELEIPDEHLEGLAEEERQDLINDMVLQEMWEHLSFDYEIVGG